MTDMKRQMPYSVPENYFENLEERILSRKKEKRSIPVSAIAASLLVLVAAGAFLLGRSGIEAPVPSNGEEAVIEYLIDSGAPLAYFEDII